MKFFLLIAIPLLHGCVSPAVERAKEEAVLEAAANAEIRFLTPWNGEDGMSLFVRIDGNVHLIQDEVRNFSVIPKERFAERGIPGGAIVAATFLEMVDSKKDYQGVFVIRSESGPQIYRGFYVPGLGNEVEWEEVPLRFD